MNFNQYQTFWEAKTAFEKIFSELKRARKSIHIETFIFNDDVVGKKLISILIKKSKKIPVTIIVDGYGLKHMSRKVWREIKESNIQFIIFNPFWLYIRKFSIRKWFRAMPYRSHRKLTIIDEEVAYIGGMNYEKEELKWHDLMIKIKGPILKQIVSTAKEMTKIATRKPTKRRNIIKQNTKLYQGSDCITRQIPISKHRPLKKQLKRIFRSAKKEVCLTTPYFIPNPQFQQIINNAIKRDIKVKILVPNKSDKNVADIITNMNLFIAHKAGAEIRLHPKMTHAKYIISDEYMCSFGSANMDYQSFFNNYELNITSQKKKLITELKKQFDSDWEKSKKYGTDLWFKRSRINRIKEKIIHPFRKYL